jgi:hypothetical protein
VHTVFVLICYVRRQKKERKKEKGGLLTVAGANLIGGSLITDIIHSKEIIKVKVSISSAH